MKRTLALLYGPLTAAYLFMITIYPVDEATRLRRHLSLGQARLAALSIAIPLVLVWLIAFYGALRLHQYAGSIKKYKDGAALVMLSQGIYLLALYMPVRALSKIILNYVTVHWPHSELICVIAATYIPMVLLLIAFLRVSLAASTLRLQVKPRIGIQALYGLAVTFILLGVSYCYVSITAKEYLAPTNWLVIPQTDIPMVLRLVTVVVPFLFIWFIGLVAAYELYLYQVHVKGIFYRRSLRLLTTGLIGVVLVSILLQFATATAGRLQHISLSIVLIGAYGMVMLVGASFVAITKGIQHLKRLDTV